MFGPESIFGRAGLRLVAILALLFLLAACYPDPQPAGLTPIPSLAPGATLEPIVAVSGAAAEATAAQPAAEGAAAPTQAAAGGEKPAQAAGGQAGVGDPAKGQTLFAQSCAPCHGQNGVGGAVGPKLAANKFVQSGGQPLHDTIANGRSGTAMPAWSQAKGGSLSDQQISDVIAYLETLQK